MGRADSILSDRMIFCFGARRSGTYLLQRIVAAHPQVSAVPSETYLFSHGVRPLLERFHHGARSSTEVGSMYADRDLLLDATRDFCDRMLGEFLEPGSERLVERTPQHASVSELIGEIYPDARFLHVIRDGRDVARSLVAQEWGPDSVDDAAREWRDSVLAGRAIAGHPRYVELRYEELLSSPEATVEQLFRSLELEPTPAALKAAAAALAERRNLSPSGEEVGVGKWRADWSADELEAFELVAGNLLREMGYETGGPADAPARAREGPREPAEHDGAEAPAGASATPEGLLDRFLTALRRGRPEAAVGLLAPNAELSLQTPAGLQSWHGEAARERLLATLRDDPALSGRQLSSHLLPGRPTVVGALSFEAEGGRRATRLVALREEGGRIASLLISGYGVSS